ncbi:unnamed protein product [Rotaria sp. Silwood1]|nr:unnamed protein product [Rotaria sp. Silwood1]
MKSRKGRDNDDISADKFKVGELSLLRWLHEIFVDIWQNEGIVDHWILAIFIRFFKNKDIQKAYDSVKKELLWKICQHYGLTKKNRSVT